MNRIRSRAVKKFYYCCKNFISQPMYDSEGAECPKCGWSVVKMKKPKSENEARATLLQLAILNHLDTDKLLSVKYTCPKCGRLYHFHFTTMCPECNCCNNSDL